MVGGAAGSALGFLIGGPEGAVLGGTAGAAAKDLFKTIGDVAHRSLSIREEIRISTASVLAVEEIRTRLKSGELVRGDGFFGYNDHNSRSEAQEIFEGMLLKCKDAHQEKKIPFIAKVFVNPAFSVDIGASEANHVLQVAESLTFRQMCFMAIVERKSELVGIQLADREASAEDEELILKDISALQEIYQLQQSGIMRLRLGNDTEEGGPAQIQLGNSYLAVFDLEEIVPARMELSDMGKRYYSIMGLSEIPVEQLIEVASDLQG